MKIKKWRMATIDERAAYDGVYPLGHIIELRSNEHPMLYVENLPVSDGDPKYEVMAPDGYHFSEQVHSLLCFSRQDVFDRVAWNDLEKCNESCGQ